MRPLMTPHVRAISVRTWRGKLLLLLLGFSIAPLLAQALWDYLATRRAYQLTTLESLQGLAHAKAQALEQLASDRRKELERIAPLLVLRVRGVLAATAAGVVPQPKAAGTMPILKDAEALPTSGPALNADTNATRPPPAPAPLQALREGLALVLWDQSQFEELLVIDREGRVVASTHAEHEGHNAEALQYFRSGLERTYVSPVFLSPLTNKLTMIIATPVRDPVQGGIGVLAARLNLQRLFAIVSETTGLGDSGETIVGQRQERRVLFTAPTRHDPAAALQRAVALDGERERGLLEAARGRSGSGRVDDYRGVDSFAAWEHVAALDWGVVCKIDRSEALRPAVRAGLRALALMIPLIVGILWVSLLASRALVQPLVDLREAADQISRGDLDVQLNIRSQDEVGALADSFDRMVAAIKFFRSRSRRLEEDEDEEEAYDEEMTGR